MPIDDSPPPLSPPTLLPPPRRPGARLRLAALLIAVLGLLSAAAVWVTADPADGADAGGYRIVGGQVDALGDSAAADRQTERLGGRALVRTAAFDRWLGSLWHGRRLAFTLAGLALAAALACLWIAGPGDPPAD